jgi:hypothetical protein
LQSAPPAEHVSGFEDARWILDARKYMREIGDENASPREKNASLREELIAVTDRCEIFEDKTEAAEADVARLTRERDAALLQLSKAKTENERLVNEAVAYYFDGEQVRKRGRIFGLYEAINALRDGPWKGAVIDQTVEAIRQRARSLA